MTEKKISIPLIIGGIVLVIVIGAGGIYFMITQNKPTDNSQNNSPISSLVNNSQSATSISSESSISSQNSTQSKYKDGTYTESGSYDSPGGEHNVSVTVTLSNSNVTAVTAQGDATDPESSRYERRFSSGIADIVVGKPLDQALVNGNVNGSSLTGDGFNMAIAKIQQDALIK